MFFQNPKLLWLLVLPALLLVHYLYLELTGRKPHLRVSTAQPWTRTGLSPLAVLRHVPFALRLAALCLIIICLARPRSSENFERVDTEGIDIVLAMDVSTSMLARDFTRTASAPRRTSRSSLSPSGRPTASASSSSRARAIRSAR